MDDDDEIERLLRGLDLPHVEEDRFGGAAPPSLDDLGELGDDWGAW